MHKNKIQVQETHILKNLEDTKRLAKKLSSEFGKRQVIGLQGDMGSGKTHFVKALTEVLGLDSRDANSPTFAIHQQYENDRVTLHHLDLFRLETEDEIESSGFWDLFYEDNVVIAVEWIDRIVDDQIPQNFSYIRMDWEILGDESRKVTVSKKS